MAVETVAYARTEHARTEDASSDERWAAWVARGVEHDRQFTKHVIVVATVVAIVVGVWLGYNV